jgi:hypothetical protein
MVWEGIMGDRKTELVVVCGNPTAQSNVHILAKTLLPFMQGHGHRFTFQQDNARPHTSRLTANFLARNHINVLPWPAVFLDMNLGEE